MRNIKNILFFIHQYVKQLQKKWKSLLLLFVFPILIISIVSFMVISLIDSPSDSKIAMALVDEDQTEETKMISSFLKTSFSQDGSVELTIMSEEEAIIQIEENEISAYIVLPKQFTESMYNGNSLTIPIVGNANQKTDSFIVKELVESFTRYIETAQANILTVYDYARKTDMSNDTYQNYRYELFIEFTLFTLAKDQLVKEKTITNIATSSPTHFFTLSGWFLAFTIWLFGLYTILRKDESPSLIIRLKLLGLTIWQNVLSRIIVSFACGLFLAWVGFLVIANYFSLNLYVVDYLRLMHYTTLYGLLILLGISIIDVWIKSVKMAMLIQILFLFFIIITSGSIIPSIYLPLSLQDVLPYIFSNEIFNWITDIALEDRNYAEFTRLTITTITGFVLLWLSTTVKERWGS
ncbi:ABC transporter permease [Ureibacillus acetophenoni]|uniref:ABC transporter permease n=1 Tax=Ureibacillus acetophenoni TaxID=614649 RepID=UPI001481DAB9|nr:ABC transporter permease [Ureibacillus acetophenoni]